MENIGAENICKIMIVESEQRRLFHPKLHDNFLERVVRHKKPSGIKKCLFGKADPDDTRRMLGEQYALDQQRIYSKFGFDIETIEHLERSENDVKSNIENDRNEHNRVSKNVLAGNVKNLGRKILKARRKVSFSKAQANQSQQFITDFYQARKSNSVLMEKKPAAQQQSTNKNLSLENY